jgi:hypothetical protein
MISGDRIAPEAVFDPEGAVEKWIILLGCRSIEPNTPEPLKGL